MTSTLKAGWYYDVVGSSGGQRWWDGQRWTERYQAARPTASNKTSTAGDGGRRWKLIEGAPVAATPATLLRYAQALGHPLYWIGPYEEYTYELSESAGHEIYIRYLPPGVELGDPSTAYTTIGTYLVPNAYETLQARVERGELESEDISTDGIAFWDVERPTSIYMAYPDFPFLVEVYDPDPEHAHRIACSDEVEPVR